MTLMKLQWVLACRDEGEESKIIIKVLFVVSWVECLGMGDPFQLVPEVKFNKESNEPMYTSLQWGEVA